MSRFTEVALTDLRVGDVVEDAYANAAVVVKIRPTLPGHDPNPHQVTIMQLAGSDRGRLTSLPLYIRRMTDPALAETVRESARKIWREKNGR